MAVTTEQKGAVIEKFARAKGDTGSPEVQVALLTNRINTLSPHFEQHKKDNLKSTDEARYSKLIADLGLRR